MATGNTQKKHAHFNRNKNNHSDKSTITNTKDAFTISFVGLLNEIDIKDQLKSKPEQFL